MNKRQRDYHNTKGILKAAISRLKSGDITNPNLLLRAKNGKSIKINRTNVEQEAGLSNGALKRHEDLFILIEQAESERLYCDDATSSSETPNSKLVLKLKEDVRSLRKQKADLGEKVDRLSLELHKKDELLKFYIEQADELYTALWERLPPQDHELRISSSKQFNNVVELKKRELEI
ncbi:hypothetical protein [Paraferrimonas haliotis]|uniref:Uncharacterized protein n=1 Tax=Paraferrimonas haliotis TaxID=2013866 RepID=A0AA37TQU5_9GAMM|nr:hypothetical protein [Paraferrimonas haliotis]GLS83745.1 hypothetical protein GCM10007894_17220 [Paraferrimonas haliotis]